MKWLAQSHKAGPFHQHQSKATSMPFSRTAPGPQYSFYEEGLFPIVSLCNWELGSLSFRSKWKEALLNGCHFYHCKARRLIDWAILSNPYRPWMLLLTHSLDFGLILCHPLEPEVLDNRLVFERALVSLLRMSVKAGKLSERMHEWREGSACFPSTGISEAIWSIRWFKNNKNKNIFISSGILAESLMGTKDLPRY